MAIVITCSGVRERAMKLRNIGDRLGAPLAGLLGCALAVGVIAIAGHLKAVHAPKAPTARRASAWKAPVRRRPSPTVVPPRVTAPPRGAAVSREALAPKPPPPALGSATAAKLEERWGIRLCRIGLAMGNGMVDLRYTVTDWEKASTLADWQAPAYLLDAATGARLLLPRPPEQGCVPPLWNRLATGKMYFAMVANPHGVLRTGSEVTLVIGDCSVSHLTVE
jgi:hypothetical protein